MIGVLSYILWPLAGVFVLSVIGVLADKLLWITPRTPVSWDAAKQILMVHVEWPGRTEAFWRDGCKWYTMPSVREVHFAAVDKPRRLRAWARFFQEHKAPPTDVLLESAQRIILCAAKPSMDKISHPNKPKPWRAPPSNLNSDEYAALVLYSRMQVMGQSPKGYAIEETRDMDWNG